MSTIKEKRMRLGLSQNDFAKKLGVNQNSVSNWERGVRTPRPQTLKAIAKILNCTIDEILS